MDYVLWMEEKWGEDRKIVNLGIIYAPCDGRRKLALYSELSSRKESKKEENVCVTGVQCN